MREVFIGHYKTAMIAFIEIPSGAGLYWRQGSISDRVVFGVEACIAARSIFDDRVLNLMIHDYSHFLWSFFFFLKMDYKFSFSLTLKQPLEQCFMLGRVLFEVGLYLKRGLCQLWPFIFLFIFLKLDWRF